MKNSIKKALADYHTIGNTPLVRLKRLFPNREIYGKLEMYNPSGSLKDRSAFAILKNAYEQGYISEDSVIIESTSGNMGVALAKLCHFLGLSLMLVSDPHINPHTEKLLNLYGATLVKVKQHDGAGGYLKTRLKKVQQLIDEIPNSFWTNQYQNPNNPQAHQQIMRELLVQLEGAPDYIFVATSTCGTITGIANEIERQQLNTKVIAVDAKGSIIFCPGSSPRLIPGMGASRPSDFLNPEQIHGVVHINDQDCIKGCRALLRSESILAGGSSGAVIEAITRILPELPQKNSVVAVLADHGERYLDTVYADKWVHAHFEKKRLVF